MSRPLENRPSIDAYGLARIEGSMRYFTRVRILRTDAKYGDVELFLINGARVRVYAEEAIKRWPREAEFELEE